MREWVVIVTLLAPGAPSMVMAAAETALAELDPLVEMTSAGRYAISIGSEGSLDRAVTDAIVAVSRAVSQARIVSVEAVTLDEYESRQPPVALPDEVVTEPGPPAAANPRHEARLRSALSALRLTDIARPESDPVGSSTLS